MGEQCPSKVDSCQTGRSAIRANVGFGEVHHLFLDDLFKATLDFLKGLPMGTSERGVNFL